MPEETPEETKNASNDSVAKWAVQSMKELKNLDQESAHIAADELLCRVLKHLGYDELVDEFNKIDKWYA